MRNNLKTGMYFILFSLIFWVIISYITNNFNPYKWGFDTRVIHMLLSVIATALKISGDEIFKR